jgi:quercetin dioxygenase-like cupin family protein
MRTRAARSSGNGGTTKTKGAYKGGRGGKYVFDLYGLKRILAGGAAGTKGHYADTRAVVVEGRKVQVGLAFEKRGCGSRPHTHPNEQFNFVVKGTFKVDVGREKGMLAPAGSVVYFPANVIHRSVATPDEDGIFFVVKDLSHGIAGTPAAKAKRGARHAPQSSHRARRPKVKA